MTVVQKLLERLAAHSITVSVHGEGLRLVGPRGFLSTDVRAEVARNKRAMLEELKRGSGVDEGTSETSKSSQTVFCDVPSGVPPRQSFPESPLVESSTNEGLSVISVTSSAIPSQTSLGDTRDGAGQRVSLWLETITGRIIPAADLLATDSLADICHACKQARWWVSRRSGHRLCRVCHPPPNSEVEG